jgi:hypothetical protein
MSKRGLRFYAYSQQQVGRPYGLGQADCLTLLLDLCEHAGVPVPESFEGVTRESYADLYRTDPRRANEILMQFLESVADPIPTERTITGDILVAVPRHQPDHEPFLLIRAGGDRVLGAFADRGRVDLGPIRGYQVLRAYRLRRPQ